MSWLVLTCAVLCGAGCARRDERWLLQCAPQAPPELLRSLARDDDEAFGRYCERAGLQRLQQAQLDLTNAARGEHPTQTGARFRRTVPYLQRIADQLARQYSFPTSAENFAWLRTLDDEQLHRWFGLRAQLLELLQMRSLEPQQGLARALQLQAQFEAVGYTGAKANLLGFAGDLFGARGDIAQQKLWVQRAVAAARETRTWGQLCQYLGVLGVIHEVQAEPDSMALCWNEALALARRMRHAEQAGRITTFYADHFDREGRLELAQQWFEESARLCREFNGEAIEARYVLRAARFYADLGCWDIVDRHLQRARKLLDDPHLLADPWSLRLYRFDSELLEARRQMAVGDVDAGNRRFAALDSTLADICEYCDRWSDTHRHWAEGLAAQGRAPQARSVAQRTLTIAREHDAAALEARMWLVMARAALVEAATDSCRAYLARFAARVTGQDASLRREWVEHDALTVRAYWTAGDAGAARAALDAGMSRLQSIVRATDASPAGYLFLDSCRELRLAGHALWAGDAARGLAIERQWRGLAELLGVERGLAASPARSAVGPLAGASPHAGAGIAESRPTDRPDPVHDRRPGDVALVYLMTPHDVLRWTSTATGLRVDSLALEPRALTQRIRSLVHSLRDDHRDALSSLQRELTDLATQLLPPEVVQPPHDLDERNTLWIAADGALTLLPFGALRVGAEHPQFLVERFGVATDRLLSTSPRVSRAELAVVVANPRTSEAMRVRQQLPDLPHSGSEGLRWAAAQRQALVLADGRATRPRLLEAWEQAGSLYFATHAVQNAELPYLQLLPLAADSLRSPAADVVGVTDIRHADLARCRLVVLSACQSGARFLEGQAQGPSLAEAFLDAGAAAVVHTLWPVRDDAAHRIMREFASAWSANAEDPVRALSIALRAGAARTVAAVESGDARPLEWAAYGVQVRGTAFEPQAKR